MRSNFYIIVICLWIGVGQSFSQDTIRPKIEVHGYLKTLQTAYVLNNNQLITDQLIHNRLNFTIPVNENHQIIAQVRNRLFYGQAVQFTQALNGNYLDGVNPDKDRWLNLSVGGESKTGLAFLSTLDRAYWEWTPENWEFRIGRQRVNWGISTIWNPNDIFNAYGFTDFDYEERPAVDAVRLKRFIGYSGSVELVGAIGRDFKDFSVGAMYKTNIKTYDLQVLTGFTDKNYVIGAGTAGNLGLAGLKAETSVFIPQNINEDVALSATFAVDYTFSGGLYLSGGGLYNSLGSTTGSLASLFNFELSARNLYPYRWSALLAANYQITELMGGGLVAVYSPGPSHALFLSPSLTYSIAQSWDLDFIGQLAFNRDNGSYKSPVQGLFLRLKWSF